MTETELRNLISTAKMACLPHQTTVEMIMWLLATELEKRLGPPPGVTRVPNIMMDSRIGGVEAS